MHLSAKLPSDFARDAGLAVDASLVFQGKEAIAFMRDHFHRYLPPAFTTACVGLALDHQAYLRAANSDYEGESFHASLQKDIAVAIDVEGEEHVS